MADEDLSTAILNNKTPNTVLVVPGNLEISLLTLNKATATKMQFFENEYVLVRGKIRRKLVLILKIDSELRDNEIGLSPESRNNLRVTVGDTVKLYVCEDIKHLTSCRILPVASQIAHINSSDAVFEAIKQKFAALGALPITKDQIIRLTIGMTAVAFIVKELYADNAEVEYGIIIQNQTITDTDGTVEEEDVTHHENMIGYDSVGGCRRQIAQIRELVELPLKYPELYVKLGVKPPKGILLFGPPGTGKTLIARAIANETGAFLFTINGPEIMSKMSGESESNLRKVFEEATKQAPSIIFMDEIDSLAPKRDKTHNEVERRIVSQLLTLMDGMNPRANVLVIAATNRPNSIDQALRRYGRFDREIEIGVPDATGRLQILGIHTRNMVLDENVDLDELSKLTHGFVGSDIASLCAEAALQQIREKLPQIDLNQQKIDIEVLDSLRVTKDNFDYAVKNTDPSSLRETVIQIPDIKWTDIGGLSDVKRELKETVQFPVDHADKFFAFGMTPSRGVLFYGPPGCGKTLLAKAIASECKANFISVKGPELITMWVGESEANIREVFDKARGAAPCVIFFDELDSIAKPRSSNAGSSDALDRVINQLLTEMDGMNQKKNVFVIGATNRPDHIDPALMRPGRLDQLIYIPLPDFASRISILTASLLKTPIDKSVSLERIAEITHGFSGADLNEICQRACKLAVREWVEDEVKEVNTDKPRVLTETHFENAMKNARKSVSDAEVKRYESFARSTRLNPSQTKLGTNDDEADDLYGN